MVPVSATSGENIETLIEVMTSQLPEGPKFYPDDHLTDEDSDTRISEAIREAALAGLKDELPHSIAVEVDEILPDPERNGVLTVHAIIYVERPGQKDIIVGRNGQRLGRIIHNSRKDIIKILGQNVFLDLRIKILKNWQSDPKALNRLGF